MILRLSPHERMNSMRYVQGSLIGCILAAVVPASAGAQQACAPMTAVFERFRAEHGEVPAVAMQDRHGNRLIVLANPATRSWSMFVLPSTNDAFACLVAAGNEFAPGILPHGRQS